MQKRPTRVALIPTCSSRQTIRSGFACSRRLFLAGSDAGKSPTPCISLLPAKLLRRYPLLSLPTGANIGARLERLLIEGCLSLNEQGARPWRKQSNQAIRGRLRKRDNQKIERCS